MTRKTRHEVIDLFVAIFLPVFFVGGILFVILWSTHEQKTNPNAFKSDYQILCESKGGYYVSSSAFSTPTCDFNVK